MRYINKYTTSGDVQTALENETLVKPYLAYITSEDKIDYNSQSLAPTGYTAQYLTIEIISGGTITWTNKNSVSKVISYSLDNGTTWTEWDSVDSTGINVSNGDIIFLKGDNSAYCSDSSPLMAYAYFSASTGTRFNIYGNIMSLVDSTGFATATTLTGIYNFNKMFYLSEGVADASNLILPATTLTEACYYQMFAGCTGLTNAPTLPAATLTTYCYRRMFSGCTSLSAITCLATDISADSCTQSWVNGVASTGTFTKDANMTSWTSGVNGIPTGWTVVDAS